MKLTSQSFLALAVGGLLLLPGPGVWAYSHHASKVRFVEHSPEAFETARRERKPVFLLISAVWCYWCKLDLGLSVRWQKALFAAAILLAIVLFAIFWAGRWY